MSTTEAIEVLDTVSDILLELNDQFDINIVFEFDNILNVESDYNRIVTILNTIGRINKNAEIPTLTFKIDTKKGIAINDFHDAYEKRDRPVYIRRKKMVAESTSNIINKFESIKNRLSSILDGYKLKINDIKYNDYPFILIGVPHGLVKLPLFEECPLDENDIIPMWKSNIVLKSYKVSKEKIDNNSDIQLYYASIPFEISKIKPPVIKKSFKDRIKKFIDL